MKKILIIALITMFGITAAAQKKNTETIEIQTSAKCGMCKNRIEKEMRLEKGVRSVSLDNETKKLKIVYRTDRTNPEKLKLAISKIGYDADEMPADNDAHDRLPACCRRTAKPH